MPKLHLKRTPEEEATRRLRKEKKKAHKRRRTNDDPHPNESRKRSRHETETFETYNGRKWASDDEDFIGPEPAESSSKTYNNTFNYPESESYRHASKPDYDAIQAELEDRRFREKLSTAFDEDEAFDSLEARLNSFAHVPMHWGGGQSRRAKLNHDADDFLKLDPMSLDEEDYVEWIRRGMYRKTHAQEYEEEERKKSERNSKRAREKAIQAETARLEREASHEQRRKKREKENRRRLEAIEVYHDRWKKLLSMHPSDSLTTLGFNDIPWPVFPCEYDRKRSSGPRISLEDLSKDAISTFLFTSTTVSPFPDKVEDSEKEKKDKKDKLRETFLRFHPDKFEGRFMLRVPQGEQEKVRMGLANVVRALNDLITES